MTHLVPYDTLALLFSDINPVDGQNIRADNFRHTGGHE